MPERATDTAATARQQEVPEIDGSLLPEKA